MFKLEDYGGQEYWNKNESPTGKKHTSVRWEDGENR